MWDFLQHTLTFLVTGLVIGVAVRAARQPPPTGDLGGTVLVYPRVLRGFFLFGAVFFLVASIGTILAVTLDEDTSPALLLTLSVFVPLAWLCLGERRVRIVLDDQGLVARTAFRGEVRMTWNTMGRITFSSWNRWYVLEDQHGQRVRISLLLVGSRALIGFLERHVDRALWEPAARKAETARGRIF